MQRIISYFIVFVLLIFSGSLLKANTDEGKRCLPIISKITSIFTEEIESKYDVSFTCAWETISYDVPAIDVFFDAYRKGTIEEARFFEVKAMQRLQELINANEELRPFLRECPPRTAISILFKKRDGSRYTDGSIVRALLMEGKLSYVAQEPKEGNNVEIFNESYEKAVEIVESQSR